MRRISKIFIYSICFIFLYNSFSYAKTVDINGLRVVLDVETTKKSIGTGFDTKSKTEYSDTEHEKDEKEIFDESVKVSLSIKNTNLYENCDVTIKEIVNGGFKQNGTNKQEKVINIKLGKGEEKTYKYNYRYNKKFLREQFNEFISGESNEVVYDENGEIVTDREKAKLILEERKKNAKEDKSTNILLDETKTKRKAEYKWIFVILISFFIVILVGVCFYIFFVKLKDKTEKGDNDYSKYNYYDNLNGICIILILSMLISILFNSNLYASSYTPKIYESGQSFTKNVTETIVFNERYFDFTYEIKVKFENRNEITDFDIDSDLDGLSDALEYTYMTDKDNIDTDGDGLSDYLEVMVFNYDPRSRYTFNDGMNDGYRDYDMDGLRNIKEIELGTDPLLYDTDGDNLSDYEEINGVKSKDGTKVYVLDPLKVDTDDDGLNDDVEIKLGLDPTNACTDGVTPDSERKIKQEYDLFYIPENLTNKLFPITSIECEVNGEIEKAIKIQEFKDVNLDNSNLLIGTPISIEFNSENNGATANITIDCSAYEDRIKKLTFVKYENGKMEVVKTKLDGSSLSADFGSGNYGIVDAEQYLRKLNIYTGDY